jgi:excisionase family DNA binding protein
VGADFFKITDVAKLLGVSRGTIWNKIKRGELNAFKVGRDYRIFESDLMVYITNCNKNKGGNV